MNLPLWVSELQAIQFCFHAPPAPFFLNVIMQLEAVLLLFFLPPLRMPLDWIMGILNGRNCEMLQTAKLCLCYLHFWAGQMKMLNPLNHMWVSNKTQPLHTERAMERNYRVCHLSRRNQFHSIITLAGSRIITLPYSIVNVSFNCKTGFCVCLNIWIPS